MPDSYSNVKAAGPPPPPPPPKTKVDYRFLKDCSNLMRRCRIHGNNIVSSIHGITSFILLNQQSSKFTLHCDTINSYKRDHHLLVTAPFIRIVFIIIRVLAKFMAVEKVYN